MNKNILRSLEHVICPRKYVYIQERRKHSSIPKLWGGYALEISSLYLPLSNQVMLQLVALCDQTKIACSGVEE